MNFKNACKFLPLVALLSMGACSGKADKAADAESQQEAIPNVRVEDVKVVPVDQLSNFTATIEADAINNIAPAMGGRIRRIHVDVGARVGRGQTLVTMDAASYNQQQTQIATLKRDYERYLELYEVGGISKQQLEQLKSQLDVAQTALNNVSENTVLKSPISGVVTARNYDPGDVAAGLPILTVQSMNPVKVIVNVSESFYSQVTKGMEAQIAIDALGDETFTGKVSLLHPTFDPVSHTFPVEIQVSNPEMRIRPGMFARVSMNFGTNERPLISDLAVLKQSGSNERYVFVENNGKIKYQVVELGTRVGDKYEIVSGLQQGDRVLVSGHQSLTDGATVKVVE